MKKGENKKGFTLIEVVLVLAVAGLIFLAVFIALPALQRQSRDTQRREDMFKLIAAIKKYQQNNRGALPDENKWRTELSEYLPAEFKDPSGGDYLINAVKCGVSSGSFCEINDTAAGWKFPNSYNVYVVIGAVCDGESVKASNNSRRVVVLYKLEGGGIYCGDS